MAAKGSKYDRNVTEYNRSQPIPSRRGRDDKAENRPNLECADLSAPWSAATWRRLPATLNSTLRRLRQVAEEQSADRSAHCKSQTPKLIVRREWVVKTPYVAPVLHPRPADPAGNVVTTGQ